MRYPQEWIEDRLVIKNPSDLNKYKDAPDSVLLSNGWEVIYDPAANATVDNVFIFAAAGKGSGRFVRSKGAAIDLRDYSVRADGNTDNTTEVMRAFTENPSGRIYFHDGVYQIGGTIPIGENSRVSGNGRTVTRINSATSGPAFLYHSPIRTGDSGFVSDSAIKFSDLTFFGKSFIELNQSGDFATVFNQQDYLMKTEFKRLSLYGVADTLTDTDRDTIVQPSLSQLLSQGTAFRLVKCYEGEIKNCIIQNFGIGQYMDGCDLTLSQNNRYTGCARWVHVYGHDTHGYSTRHRDNFYSGNRRYGGFYIDHTNFTEISGSYFETYLLSACYIQTVGDIGTSVVNNKRFDDTRQNTNVFDFKPRYGLMVMGNGYNPSTGGRNVSIVPDESWSLTQPELAIWKDNQLEFPVPLAAAGVRTRDFDPYLFSPHNFGGVAGVAATSFPFVTSEVTGETVVQTETDTLIVYFNLPSDFKTINLHVVGRCTGTHAGGGFSAITWGGVSVFSGFIALANEDVAEKVVIPLSKPNGLGGGIKVLHIELVNTQIEISSIRVEQTYITA